MEGRMESQTQFQNLSEQLVFYVKRFVLFCVDCLRDIGKEGLPEPPHIEAAISAIPDVIWIKYVIETKEKYGEKLDQEDLSVVAKLIVEHSRALTVDGITKDMEMFTKFLSDNPNSKKKFFSYWRVIKAIVTKAQ